ncbi:hypothetical protein ACGFNX_40725 [Streptomyces sp. NPDC048723]|uniref:hypothetical protein n=1 Tax=unclassified Streptomyces TaxID=2593676 RepID=UPI003566586C
MSIPADDDNPGRIGGIDGDHKAVPNGPHAYGPETCLPGYVWRDSYDGDAVCVKPEERQAVHDQNPNRQPGGGAYGPRTCKPGYVWREKWDGDTQCVTPEERAYAKSGIDEKVTVPRIG